jgi:hypothetical protein
MRRALILSALFGTFVAGLGCKHVGGRCDCTHDPQAHVAVPAGNPYHVVGQPVPGTAVPAPAPMPMGK